MKPKKIVLPEMPKAPRKKRTRIRTCETCKTDCVCKDVHGVCRYHAYKEEFKQ